MKIHDSRLFPSLYMVWVGPGSPKSNWNGYVIADPKHTPLEDTLRARDCCRVSRCYIEVASKAVGLPCWILPGYCGIIPG